MNVAMSLEAQMSAISNRLNSMEAKLDSTSVPSCGLCPGDNHIDQCNLVDELVNFVKNFKSL